MLYELQIRNAGSGQFFGNFANIDRLDVVACGIALVSGVNRTFFLFTKKSCSVEQQFDSDLTFQIRIRLLCGSTVSRASVVLQPVLVITAQRVRYRLIDAIAGK